MATWAIANQKGGVGKTAVTLGLGSGLLAAGAKTLVVDMDPQASTSKVLGIENADLDMYDLMMATSDYPISEVVVPTAWGFDLAPSGISLAKREQNRDVGVESKLRKALEGNGYDVVLVDCPPSLGILTINALTAADYVLIVTTPAFASMRGLSDLLIGQETEELGRQVHEQSTIEAVTEYYNQKLQVAGFVINQMDGTGDAKRYQEELREVFGDQVWSPSIPRRASLNESYTQGVPLAELPQGQAGARQLRLVFEELAQRLLLHQGTPTNAEGASDEAVVGGAAR
jgi:chromosome partitioning protein